MSDGTRSTHHPAEWRFVGVVIILILIVTSIPYLYGYLSTPADKHFMGLMLDVPDHAQYFSWMRDLTTAYLAPNKLTPEPNRAIFFNLLWWGLGRLGHLLGVGYEVMFQVLRFSGGALFLLLAYRVCACFLDDRLHRRAAFLVIALTSGFGWVLIGIKYALRLSDPPFPLLVYIAEGNTFLGIMGYPHFIVAALYILAFDLVLRGEAKGQLRYAFYAGLFALFLGWQHAYDLLLIYGILGAYGLLRLLRDRAIPMYLLKSGIILGLISCWPAVYSVLLTSLDPVWDEVLKQFANAGVYTPNPLQLPILLGIPFLLAIYTVGRDNPLNLKAYPNDRLFLLAWFAANVLLIYIPTDFQIHMLNGWQVPIAILSVRGFFQYILPWIERTSGDKLKIAGSKALLAALLILSIIPTNLYLWSWRFVELARHDYPYYLHTDEISAMAWLEANANPDDVIFSSETIGQYVPMLTGAHAFLAHWAQTLDYKGKVPMVAEFFDTDTSDARRLAILQNYNVDYIFYGPAEKAIGGFAIYNAPYLQPVFTAPVATVYAVTAAP
jgi:hypothetical protein